MSDEAADRIAERHQDSDPSRLIDFLADERQTAALDEEPGSMGKLVDEVVDAIRKAEAKGITRYRLSLDSGVDHAVIFRLVSGEGGVSVGNLEKLCAALGLRITLRKKAKRKKPKP